MLVSGRIRKFLGGLEVAPRFTGVITWPIFGGTKQYKSMVILWYFPYNNALFGLVIYTVYIYKVYLLCTYMTHDPWFPNRKLPIVFGWTSCNCLHFPKVKITHVIVRMLRWRVTARCGLPCALPKVETEGFSTRIVCQGHFLDGSKQQSGERPECSGRFFRQLEAPRCSLPPVACCQVHI